MMSRLFGLAVFSFALSFSLAQAQPIVQISLDRPSYEASESAHVRYRLAALPESPAFEFFLSANLNGAPISMNKITGTEFYSKLENLAAGLKTLSVNIYLQDKNLAASLMETVRHHDSEIQRLSDALLEADPEDVPDLEAELAMNQARRADALAKLTSIRRFMSGPHTLQFDVN